MTGNDTPSRGGPPWSLDLLADLHAGALDPEVADDLRERVAADPQARATLDALEATRRALTELPPLRMPEHVAARIDAAIAEEAANRATAPTAPLATATITAPPPPAPPSAPANVVDFAAERKRRRRGLIAGAGLLTAAAAVIGVIAVANLTGGTTTGGDPQAASPSDQAGAPLALSSDNLGAAVNDALGATDYGPLAGRDRLDACLAANGIDQGADPVGAREVTLDGRPGVLILLPAGANPPRWRLLVVAPDCGPNRPATLADTTTGR
jgi:hypothetical protein